MFQPNREVTRSNAMFSGTINIDMASLTAKFKINKLDGVLRSSNFMKAAIVRVFPMAAKKPSMYRIVRHKMRTGSSLGKFVISGWYNISSVEFIIVVVSTVEFSKRD